MPQKIKETYKFWVGLLSAIITSTLAVTTPDLPGYKILIVVQAILGAVAVYLVKNADKQDSEFPESENA